ncbi:unnamed protein product [Cuscuta campestris]|uniref:Uncharacterized protein n=1 Tax=Cuscuta campestris TaxID=132261 RepID=A0A484KHZ2_9ASTE|nr:unnamed protein product [Cuscuta campestris]
MEADDNMTPTTPIVGVDNNNFRVDFIAKSVVKAAAAAAQNKPHILPLSNLDLLAGRFPVTYFYFFRNPNHPVEAASTGLSPSVIDHFKSSLSRCLSLFYPFAGRIVANPATAYPEISCDNRGVLVVEARANIPLKELPFHDLNRCLEGGLMLVPAHQSAADGDFAVQAQITGYACGGVSLTVSFDHALGDASSLGKFLLTWSELAREMPPSCSPDHRRFLLRPRRQNTCLDEKFVSCTVEEMPTTALSRRMLKRLYHVDASSINKLQVLSGGSRTKIEAFSAYLWKVMATLGGTGGGHDDDKISCKMGWVVDGRRRMDDLLSEDYIGNVLSHAGPGRLMFSKLVLGGGLADADDGPVLMVSSARRFPVAQLDFGFGGPVLGTVCTTAENIGVGYVSQRESALGDGSWTVSAVLWPEMVAALESDPERVFRPMTADIIHL